uniref:Secreted protein n=1 Tax=Heterorhabditis bacteriophora TaxID=37862 RepID=A0A1I7X457_HETBA
MHVSYMLSPLCQNRLIVVVCQIFGRKLICSSDIQNNVSRMRIADANSVRGDIVQNVVSWGPRRSLCGIC